MSKETFKLLNLWADEDGISHFREIEYAMHPIPQGGAVSDPVAATNIWFRQTEQDQDMDWHPAPRKQLVITLMGGVAELTASDGEVRHIHPGQVVLVEDTFGKGHKSRAFDGLPRESIFVGLAD